jgi:hypothetical protein
MAVVLAVLLIGAGVGAARFWHGVRQGQESLKHDLASVANLEARALREGDRATYLWLQDRHDTAWYARQRPRAPSWGGEPTLEPGQTGDLTVVEAALAPSEEAAWAEVGWAQEDGLYRRVHFYRQVDGRWVRTGPHDDYFGPEETYQTEHFVFEYLTRDGPTVDWMAGQLEVWYAAICSDLACDDGRPIAVLVTLDDDATGEYRPPRGLTISSPRLRGVRQDGAPAPEERAELAEMLVYLLVVRRAGDVEATQQPYLLLEYVNWEMRRLGLADEETPSTPVLDLVMDSYGPEKVRALLTATGQTSSEEEALRRALGLGLSDLDESFGGYLAARLGVERQMMTWGKAEMVGDTSRPLARQIFGALLADKAGAWRSEMYAAFSGWRQGFYPSVSPSQRPRVDHWERLDEGTIWAEVSYPDAGGVPTRNVSERPLGRIEFFRQVNGAWRHTQPDKAFLGDELVLNSEHFRLVGHEREAEWMAGELARLESFYQEAAQSTGVAPSTGERLTIHIVPTATWSSLRLYPGQTEFWMLSPYFVGWHDDQGEGYLTNWLAPSLLARLAFDAAGVENPTGSLPSTREIWMYGVLNAWGREILGPDAPQVVSWAPGVKLPTQAVESVELDTLSDLARATLGSEPASYGWATEDWYTLYQEMFSMMYYIGDSYGQEALLSLLQTLPEATSLESWLRPVLDVDLETFEAEWAAWLNKGNG